MTPQKREDVGSICGGIALLCLVVILFSIPFHRVPGFEIVFVTAYLAVYVFGIIAATLHTRWWLVLPAGLLIVTLGLLYYISTMTFGF